MEAMASRLLHLHHLHLHDTWALAVVLSRCRDFAHFMCYLSRGWHLRSGCNKDKNVNMEVIREDDCDDSGGITTTLPTGVTTPGTVVTPPPPGWRRRNSSSGRSWTRSWTSSSSPRNYNYNYSTSSDYNDSITNEVRGSLLYSKLGHVRCAHSEPRIPSRTYAQLCPL